MTDPIENVTEWKESSRLVDQKGPCHSVGKNFKNKAGSTCPCWCTLEALGQPFPFNLKFMTVLRGGNCYCTYLTKTLKYRRLLSCSNINILLLGLESQINSRLCLCKNPNLATMTK